ncbi:MAG: hypothetical protein H6751_08625 [Candidatus Omnitrophica bacterium]|nr:hypothetical protein [Candidatus Omnitrophota bacterium]
MPPFLDYLLVSAAVIAACVYLFFTYRKKKCGGCMGQPRKNSDQKIQIKIPKR